jgi:uncharacterized glyoxalase superfamily protein PhnB
MRAMSVAFERVAPVLPVRNVGVALEHYRKLGFDARAYEEGDPEDPIYGFLEWGPVQIHLVRVTGLEPSRNTSACYLYVDDADALFQRWTSAGVDGRLQPPRDTEYGLRELAHVDPDGNLLRIGSPVPHS